MDILISREHQDAMEAVLINRKDGLAMTVSKPSDKAPARFDTYALDSSRIEAGRFMSGAFRCAQLGIVRNRIERGDAKPYVSGSLVFAHENGGTRIRLHDVAVASSLDIYGHTLYHAVNMLRGFFASNKYRAYASSTKRGKLIAEKKRLNRKISRIDKRLDA